MDLGWVGMTKVGSEEVRTSKWTPMQRSSGTTGGISGMTSMSLKLSDRLRKRNLQLKRQKSFELDNNASQGCILSFFHDRWVILGNDPIYKIFNEDIEAFQCFCRH